MEKSGKKEQTRAKKTQSLSPQRDDSFERVRENLEKLNYDCNEKRGKLKQTQRTIAKIMKEEEKRQNRIKEKLFLVQQRREIESQLTRQKMEEQMAKVDQRILQKKAEKEAKRVLPSLKDTLAYRKEQDDLLASIIAKNKDKRAAEENIKEELIEENNESQRNIMNTSQGQQPNGNNDQVFFNLTAPIVGQFDKKQDQMMLSQQQNRKKNRGDKGKNLANPFYNKQNWDKYMEAERNGEQNIRFPGIGIERTPLYEIQQQEKERSERKKEMLQQLKKYYICPKKKEKIDFEMIYTRVKGITGTSLATLGLQPSESLLGRMMEKSVLQARLVWGKNFLKQKSEPMKEEHHFQGLETIEEKGKNHGHGSGFKTTESAAALGGGMAYFPTIISPTSEQNATLSQSQGVSPTNHQDTSSMQLGQDIHNGNQAQNAKKALKFSFPQK